MSPQLPGATRPVVPFVGIAVLAFVATGLESAGTNWGLVADTGLGAVVLSVIASLVPWSSVPASAVLVLPIAADVGIALLRHAQGGSASGYSPLAILPVAWVGLTRGRRAVALLSALHHADVRAPARDFRRAALPGHRVEKCRPLDGSGDRDGRRRQSRRGRATAAGRPAPPACRRVRPARRGADVDRHGRPRSGHRDDDRGRGGASSHRRRGRLHRVARRRRGLLRGGRGRRRRLHRTSPQGERVDYRRMLSDAAGPDLQRQRERHPGRARRHAGWSGRAR